MHRTEGDGYVVNGGKNQFDPGDPFIPRPATQMTYDWANAVQEELCSVIEGRGLTLDQAGKSNFSQLYQAIFTPPAWQAMTLQTPWSALSHTASYRFESNTKRVFLKGATDATISSASDWDLWQVPTGYRPPYEIHLPAAVYVDGLVKNGVLRLSLGTTPALVLHTVEGSSPVNGKSYMVYLDGLSWAID
jgi:hypothetical protein